MYLPAFGAVCLGEDAVTAVAQQEVPHFVRVGGRCWQISRPWFEATQQLLYELIIEHRNRESLSRATPEQPVEDPARRTPPALRLLRLVRPTSRTDVQILGLAE